MRRVERPPRLEAQPPPPGLQVQVPQEGRRQVGAPEPPQLHRVVVHPQQAPLAPREQPHRVLALREAPRRRVVPATRVGPRLDVAPDHVEVRERRPVEALPHQALAPGVDPQRLELDDQGGHSAQRAHNFLPRRFCRRRVQPQRARGRLAQPFRDAIRTDLPHARVVQALARDDRFVVDDEHERRVGVELEGRARRARVARQRFRAQPDRYECDLCRKRAVECQQRAPRSPHDASELPRSAGV